MAKISTLHINNFKFFGESEPIDVGGKHLLIYGENGSGKSSIYWALFTLLEAAQKNDDAEVMKYFNKGHDRSLVNLYAQPQDPEVADWRSSIIATLDNGSTYQISINEPDLRDNEDARNSNLASDFLDYRFAFKIHDVRHGQESNLFDLFLKNVFPYIQATQVFSIKGKVTRKLDEVWAYLAEGLPRGAGGRRVQSRSNDAKSYIQQANNFNDEVRRIVADASSFGNDILKNSLGYPGITFSIQYDPAITFDYYGDATAPKIKLTIPEYDGFIGAINYPQSFLNEAKLTAIAIAMRLAILTGRLSEAELKLLVLDDLLISLDMVNRQAVLDLLLDKYTFKSKDENSEDPEVIEENRKKFQVVILTHDAQFNHFIKSQIKLRGKEFDGDWKFVDMYEHVEGIIKNAVIVPNDSHLEKARSYFFAKKPDYEAAGNYLRKEAEEFTKSFLPKRQQVGRDLTPLDLSGRIQQCIDYAKNNGLDLVPFNALNQHRQFIFNVLSHDAYDVPRFRSEIGKCFKTFDEHLYKMEYQKVLDEEEQLVIELHDGTNLWKAVVVIYEPLILIKEPGKESLLAKVFANYQIYKDGIKHGKNCPDSLSIQKFYTDWYTTSDKVKSADFWKEVIISKTGEKLSTLRTF